VGYESGANVQTSGENRKGSFGMSLQDRLNEVIDSGEQVQVTFTNQKTFDHHGDQLQTVEARLVSTNTADVVEVRPIHGATVPLPVSRILTIE
jgi:hypothetical protein